MNKHQNVDAIAGKQFGNNSNIIPVENNKNKNANSCQRCSGNATANHFKYCPAMKPNVRCFNCSKLGNFSTVSKMNVNPKSSKAINVVNAEKYLDPSRDEEAKQRGSEIKYHQTSYWEEGITISILVQ